MVKHSPVLMARFFRRDRFGRPQVLAACLLLVFLGQCLCLVVKRARPGTVDLAEIYRLEHGSELWNNRGMGLGEGRAEPSDPGKADSANEPGFLPPAVENRYDAHHSQLWYLIAAAPLWLRPVSLQPENIQAIHRLAALPYLVFGLLLGASLWYVARRLFGNAGGYVALALYCFSPGIIRSCALWFAEPEVGAAWGAFGAIFTAIAVAHTLYAPREVVLWNWRRIVLLGLSLALAVASQYSLVAVVPMALGFMLYLAPTRRLAALAIWTVACGIALLLGCASYFFHAHDFLEAVRHASFFGISWKAYAMPEAYHQVAAQLGQSSPALVVALPVALITYFAWPRARYFGNTAPLLVAVLFLALGLGAPHFPGLGFQFMALPFVFVFVAGIAADLMETRYREIALASIWGLLAANAAWSLWELARTG
jgi:hypothetical protein